MKNERLTRAMWVWHALALGALLLLAFLVQSAPGTLLQIGGVRPVLLTGLCIAVGAVYGPFCGGVFGLVAGLLADSVTAPSLAFHAVFYAALGIACALAVQHLLVPGFFAFLVLSVLGSLLYATGYFLLYKLAMRGGGWYYYLHFSLPGAGYTAAASLLICLLIRLLRRLLPAVESRT